MESTATQARDRVKVAVLILPCVLASCAGSSEETGTGPSRPFPRVVLEDSALLAVSPPEERRWGFYQFPDMWRGPGGEIYLAMNVGEDAEVGVHEPTRFFVSRDEGSSWPSVSEGDVDFSPGIVTLPSGEEVAFGTERYVYHYSSYGHRKRREISLEELGIQPVVRFMDAWDVQVFAQYRYADIPQDRRRFPLARRSGSGSSWQQDFGTVDPSDLLLSVLVSAKDDKGEWHDVPPVVRVSPYYQAGSIFRPPDWPKVVLTVSDGTLLWAHSTQDPRFERTFFRVHLLASVDGGRHWKIRGTIADQPELADLGYGCGEQSLERMPNGDLLCVMRTQLGRDPEATNHLAAARSSDNGFTWSPPREIAPFSVTPHLRRLENGAVVVIYGRPGIHLRTSADSGRTWSEALTLVGPPEAKLMALTPAERWKMGSQISCSNTDVIVNGPDRFLLAYSDFLYRDEAGIRRKAIKVQQVVVQMPAGNERSTLPKNAEVTAARLGSFQHFRTRLQRLTPVQ